MATKLRKTVVREISDWCRRGLFGMGGNSKRDLIVAMEVGNVFSFREKGTRKTYRIDMETVYNLAVKAEVLGADSIKAKAKRKRKR